MTQLRDTPAPQADSGFKVGDRVRIKRGESTATILAIDSVNVADLLYDDGEKMFCPLENLEPLPPSEDPKRQPEANSAGPCGRCGDRDTVERADGILCAPCRERPWPKCEDCKAPTAHMSCRLCLYCDRRRFGHSSHLERGDGIDRIASATPKEAERGLHDWPVSDGPWDGTP